MTNHISLFVIILLNVSCNTEYYVMESGKATLHRYRMDVRSQVASPEYNLQYEILFYDSLVILERKAVVTQSNYFKDSSTQDSYFRRFKYTLLNLRDLYCQDYLALSDTSTPLNFYQLKENEYFDVPLFLVKNKAVDVSDIKKINDTIIHGDVFKRARMQRKINGSLNQYTYLFNCKKKLIFNLAPNIEYLYPDCEMMRTETRFASEPTSILITEISVHADQLSASEINIFKLWKRNLSQSNFDTLSKDEVFQQIDAGLIMNLSTQKN